MAKNVRIEHDTMGDIEVPADIRAKQITTEADLKALLLPDLAAVATRLSAWGERWERDVVAAAK